jgi:hypothetical protein
MPELAELILKRNQIIAQLNRISKFVASFPPGDNVNKIKSRMSALDDLYKEFREVQYQIELIDKPRQRQTITKRLKIHISIQRA